MIANHNLRYRANKLRTKFIPLINYFPEHCEEETKEEYDTEDEEVEYTEVVDENEQDYQVVIDMPIIIEEDTSEILGDMLLELTKIRKNAKRKLEAWIKVNRYGINGLVGKDRDELLLFIGNKYFNK